jgi:hypothetical protein
MFCETRAKLTQKSLEVKNIKKENNCSHFWEALLFTPQQQQNYYYD